MRRTAFAALFLALFAASCAVGEPRALAPSPSASAIALPNPIPQAITRTSPAAQVAWLWTRATGQKQVLIGVNPSGAVVAELDDSIITPATVVSRSADGATLFGTTSTAVTTYSALDGKAQRTYSKPSGAVVSSASSADGHWLAMITSGPAPRLDVMDLRTGMVQSAQLGHDPGAKLPGMSGQTSAAIWATVVFAPTSAPAQLYVVMDWGGPLRLTSFGLANDKLSQVANAVDGESGNRFESCGAPALVAKIVADGGVLATFCHMDGVVSLYDLKTLTSFGVVRTGQKNPFWLSPIFTPDGRLLYLHQWPDFGDEMLVVDLATRRLLGPVPTPTRIGDPGAFSWLMSVAYAGGTASTQPISPDGLKLYSATDDGLMVLRVPDLKPLARYGPGVRFGEVWVSGDGRTLYVTSDEGKRLLVMREDGGTAKAVAPNGDITLFVAAEGG